MADANKLYSHIEVLEDDTNGPIQLDIVERKHDTRRTKLSNNFIGLLSPADASIMQQLSSMLAAKIGNTGDAIVVGMHKSGIVAATALGAARNTRYAWTTPDRIAANAIEYLEDHRPDKAHYLYGLPKGSNVILVEDEITTGRGIASFATALKAHGITVVAIASYIETVNFDGRKYIRDNTGLELISLIKVRLS